MKNFRFFLSFFLFLNLHVHSQKNILDSFEAYAELPREVVYVHLNKTIFIQGEDIGFQAYVSEKGTQNLSKETNNLYCVIKDADDQVVKEQLIRVEDGFAHGNFSLDSIFQTGEYRFIAFTNWMRNFSEKNHFEERITIIDKDVPFDDRQKNTPSHDAQFLPEGGHAVAGAENTFGAIIKDHNGFGIGFITGIILDSNDQQVTDFKLDQFGVGRFSFVPRPDLSYRASFMVGGKNLEVPISPIKKKGVVMQLTDLKSSVGITFSSMGIKENLFTLALNNGKDIKAVDVDFSGSKKQVKIFKKGDLYKGLNIFTLFDKNGNPLLERLYFNFDGLNFATVNKNVSWQSDTDSLIITIPTIAANPEKANRLSVSILPAETKAYGSAHNLASYLNISPYIKTPIENVRYYFREVTAKKKFQFDNVLLTQGWSSYSWNTIFNKAPKYLFDFEKGISITGNVNKNSGTDLYIAPLENHDFEMLSVIEGQDTFRKDFLFPYQDETLSISEITSKEKARKAKLYMQFKPSAIPQVAFDKIPSQQNEALFNLYSEKNDLKSFMGFDETIKLDEVVLEEDYRKRRIEKLKDRSWGQIYAFEKDDWRRQLYLSTFLSQYGYVVYDELGVFNIAAMNPATPSNNNPLVYLDDVLLSSYNVLSRFRMDVIDYIEINWHGTGGGLWSGAGIIKIYTDPSLANTTNLEKPYNHITIPLAFSKPKRFYNPKYWNYGGAIFKKYGAIDWHSNLKVGANGTISFKIPDLGQNQIKFFLEGIVDDNQYVSESLEINF